MHYLQNQSCNLYLVELVNIVWKEERALENAHESLKLRFIFLAFTLTMTALGRLF